MSFFDEIPHELLMKKVHDRITDGKVLKLIRGWLTAGFMEDGQFHETIIGSPQGGICRAIARKFVLEPFRLGDEGERLCCCKLCR